MKLKAIEFPYQLGRANTIEIPEEYHPELRTIPHFRVILLYDEEPPISDYELEAFERFLEEDKINPSPIEGK